MPSRMNKYYQYEDKTKTRSKKNTELYDTIYEDVSYTNVEGISIIEKNETVDIDKIRELMGIKVENKPTIEEKIECYIEPEKSIEKNYDIKDVLSRAKEQREENKTNNTQYDILKNINLNSSCNVPTSLSDEDLKKMIEEITNNSRNCTGDLLDDLKTSHNLAKTLIKECDAIDTKDIDKSFFTSSLGFTQKDFEDLSEIKKDIKRNSLLTKLLIAVVVIGLIVGGIIYFV